ncbi:thioesterase II family protein [Cytobacillus purgationiresistens]|uniref:Surfactin synthase thioesterase subunit n=1 Tax=Cytobacillus purgationiresistens TaxID=863449 RepID=A0ABU0AR96_9BACI|nr:alpha/beta fold hydrolase [Cytobacillus purgationiresistens]MDQ0273728.1 surfactin synthase thioesterase subunit [Cytobacillus purgationiresistens]
MKLDLSLMQWSFNKSFNSDSKIRILFFPYACGGASIYRNWQKFFPFDIDVIPIQLPGRENRITEKPYTNIDELTTDLVDILNPLYDKPIAFFGHSMGSLISYELSVKLQQFGIKPVHLFVSAHLAPHKSNHDTRDHLLSDDQLINRLRELSFTPEPVLQNKDLMNLLLPVIRADFSMCENYNFINRPALRCPITVFGGTRDKEVSTNELDEWKYLTNDSFSKVVIDGDHFFVHNHASTITTNIIERLGLI